MSQVTTGTNLIAVGTRNTLPTGFSIQTTVVSYSPWLFYEPSLESSILNSGILEYQYEFLYSVMHASAQLMRIVHDLHQAVRWYVNTSSQR